MTQIGPVVVKQLPESGGKQRRKEFLAEVSQFARQSYRPQLIVDLPAKKIGPDTLDLLLSCVVQVEKSEGCVSVAGASPEAAVILELTQLTSVVNVFPTVSEAVGVDESYSINPLAQGDSPSVAA